MSRREAFEAFALLWACFTLIAALIWFAATGHEVLVAVIVVAALFIFTLVAAIVVWPGE